MQRFNAAFESAASRLSAAANRTRDDMVAQRLPDEPAVTSALVTRFHDALDGYEKAGIRWSAKILSSHGRGAEEAIFGADFLGVLKIEFPEFEVKKGFIAQAKRQDEGKKLTPSEWSRFEKQCTKMMKYSNTSFVFVYSQNGFVVVPAASVLACRGSEDLHTLHPMKIHHFYKQHFHCFVGDHRIQDSSPSILEELQYHSGLMVIAKSPPSRDTPLFHD